MKKNWNKEKNKFNKKLNSIFVVIYIKNKRYIYIYEENWNKEKDKGVGMINVDFGPISETVYIDIILNTIIEITSSFVNKAKEGGYVRIQNLKCVHGHGCPSNWKTLPPIYPKI